ncbi:Agglutination protein [Sphingobium herbicidovorans NBRC 16415]|uniref:Agglutination protein n=1 Tax=Sphingobium herbicidovorans (strain ATCC 700291 / DSM 11019 / CCUG 56400 / KCTC 2939 / LMG 18315 / NBRC 16415 / MH) TaxID=1219045 RepID=A0A086PCD7_SPHHM|nr:TolC family protein [Sphingobium herbicidovorans]KFG91055.1 Agglutination protein [Sphingobium herbicidovorans NBRC 16415]
MTFMRKTCGSLIALCVATMAGTAWAQTTDLKSAISAAIDSHPEINQAVQNKEAIEFEREQAKGLYLPRVSLEASAGVRRLENTTRRAIGIEDQTLWPLEAGLVAEQTIWDSGYRSAEKRRQAARIDGAALRVGERSQFVALNVTRQYLDYMLQQRVVAAAEDNIAFHRKLLGDLGEGVSQGSISIADQQQAEERLQAALVRKSEAEQDLTNAAISFRTLTGLSIDQVSMPDPVTSAVPPTLDEAIGAARTHNPLIREAEADIQAARAVVDEAQSELGPTVTLEGRGRVGEDVDGFRGSTNDVQGRVVLRWQLFNGGINRAKVQEMTRRASEARFRLSQRQREAEEDVRTAWNRWDTEKKRLADLSRQGTVSDSLLVSYREQFNVGRRSLLDVLDSQNTRFNTQVRSETARFSEIFAQYQILAATNQLLDTLGIAQPSGADPYARKKYDVPDLPPAELQRRRYPG